MGNIKIRKDVGDEKEFNADRWIGDPTDIDEVIEYFIKAKENGATHVEWLAVTDMDGESEFCEAQPFFETLETDAECKKRLENEADVQQAHLKKLEEQEKAEYVRLKTKFG
jgi:hypothetical protein